MDRSLSVNIWRNTLCVLMLGTALCHGEVIKPEKVTASSEFTKYEGHLAPTAADGKVDGKEFWCSDIQNNAKPPHWIEFDFAAPGKFQQAREFNQIQLYMCENNNLTQLFNKFKIEYWDGNKWNTIVEEKDYVSKYMDVVNGKNTIDKYTVEIPDPNPVFKFKPITASKVRLVINNLPDAGARLREMVVSMTDENAKKDSKKPSVPAVKEYPGVYCFDFGPAKTNAKPGFIKVSANTAYDAKKGYGWTSTDGLISCDRHLPSDFRRDFVVSEKTKAVNTFKVNVPPGRYYIYAMGGDILLDSPGCHLSVNGRDFEIPSSYKSDFCPEIFACEALRDGLNITIKGAGILNGLIVAPVKQWRDLQEVSGSIAVDPVYGSPKNIFTKEEQPTHNDKPQITDADKKQGYICYVNSLQQRIFPDTTPAPEQVKNIVEAAATPGEIEAASFSVYGINDVADLNITLSDLKSDSGAMLSSKNIELNVVRCWPQRSGQKGDSKTWSFVPELLEPFRLQDVPAESSRQFWLTFNVPENAVSGIYNGTITLKADKLPEKKLNLKLQVYPFKLKDTDNDFFAMYYGGRIGSKLSAFCTDPKNKEIDMIQLLDMKKHGMNSMILPSSSAPFSELSEKIKHCNKLLDEAGYPKRPIPLHHQEMTPELATQIRDFVKKENLREILFYLVDEPFNKKLDLAIKMYKLIKTVPGIRTYSTVTQNDVDNLGDNLDVRTYTITDYSKFEPDRINEECKKAGKAFWWYSNSAREYPDVVRFKAGYFYWKTASRGQAYWAYANYREDAFNDFEGRSNDHCVVYFKGGKLLSTIQWESIREGIDDYKYINTLEQLIKENSTKKPQECAKAQKVLDEIKADTIIDLNEYQKHFGKAINIHIKSFWGPEKCELYRKKVAEEIINLGK